MKVISGTVIKGKVTLPAGDVANGTRVAVLVPGATAPARLSPSREDELRASVEAVQSGSFIEGSDLIAELKAR